MSSMNLITATPAIHVHNSGKFPLFIHTKKSLRFKCPPTHLSNFDTGNSRTFGYSLGRTFSSVSSIELADASASDESPPLVLLTREAEKNCKLDSALTIHGISTLHFPLIEHSSGPDRAALPEILKSTEFDWVIITSPEAASVFLHGWEEAGFPKTRIASVGGGTSEVFAKSKISGNLTIEFTPSKANGASLGQELPSVPGGSGNVLYPASLKAGKELQSSLTARGFKVTRLSTYSTESVRKVDPSLLDAAIKVPVASFGSPTAVRAWVELLQTYGKEWDGTAACIGSTTFDAAKKLGLTKVEYPREPGIEGWVTIILAAVGAEKSAL